MNKTSSKNLHDIKVMVVSDSHQQRQAFIDSMNEIGFALIDAVNRETLLGQHLEEEIDFWLVDSEYDDELVSFIEQKRHKKVLVGFDEAPLMNEIHNYAKWKRKLTRRLAKLLDMPELVKHKVYNKERREWKYVLFLGASMGGPASVKKFLDNLSPELPICVLLAHHFNSSMIHTLPRILSRHNDWKCQVISTSQSLQAGSCLIAPVEEKIVCNSYGYIFLTDQLWEGNYQPSISELFKNTSEVYGNQLFGIMFSGMGNDGSMYLEQMQENQSHIWAQDPKSCASPSQPQAVIDSGYCQYVGNPEQLAQRLADAISIQEKLLSS